MSSWFGRIFRRGVKPDPHTVTYGETVKAESRRKNYERRIADLKESIACNNPEGPCDKLGKLDCFQCEHLSNYREMLKIAYIVSQSHAELGDRFPVEPDNHEAWKWLYNKYIADLTRFGSKHPWVQGQAKRLEMIDTSFSFRSTTKEHTRIDVADPMELLSLLAVMMNRNNAPLPTERFGRSREGT